SLYNLRVKVGPGQRPNVCPRFLLLPGLAVRTVRSERIPDIDDSKDARRQRNLLAFQTTRVARAVPSLMMAIGNVQSVLEKSDGREKLVAVRGMAFHDAPFVLRERSGLDQNAVRNGYLADI